MERVVGTLKEAADRGRSLRERFPRRFLATLGERPVDYDPVERL